MDDTPLTPENAPQNQIPETQPGVVETPQIPPNNSKTPRKKLLLVLLLLILMLVAAVTYYFVFKKAPAKTTSSSQPKLSTQTVKKSTAFYTSHNSGGNPQTTTLFRIDPASKKQDTVIKYSGTNKSIITVKTSSGKDRTFYTVWETKDNKDTESIVYQDGSGPITTIYTVSNNSNSTDATSFTTGYGENVSVDPSGKDIDFLEYNPKSVSIKRVSIDKVVTTLATSTFDTKNAWNIAGNTHNYLVPSARSNDGKRIYLASLNCVQCDGGGVSDILLLDPSTKVVSMLYQENKPGSPNPESGNWIKLDETHFAIRNTGQSALGITNYDEDLKISTQILVFDTISKSTQNIFMTTGPHEHTANILGKSSDGKTIYVQIAGLEKGPIDTSNTKQVVYSSKSPVKNIRAYSVKDGTYKIVDTGIDYVKQSIDFMNKKDETLIYSVSPNLGNGSQPTAESTISLFAKDDSATKAEELASFKGQYQYLQFLGFVQ